MVLRSDWSLTQSEDLWEQNVASNQSDAVAHWEDSADMAARGSVLRAVSAKATRPWCGTFQPWVQVNKAKKGSDPNAKTQQFSW
jgi:hypothetical protein